MNNNLQNGQNGRGKRRGFGKRGRGNQRGGRNNRSGSRGSDFCICPSCGFKEEHKRGTPCTELKCPKCGTQLKGENCINSSH